MSTARKDRIKEIFDEVARGTNLDRALNLIADQVAADLGAPTCKIWVVKRGDICNRCPLASICPNREMCMHLVAASGAAIDKEYPRIPLSVFNASLIARGGTASFGDPNDAGEKLFGLQHGAHNEGRDSYALYPLRSVSGTVGLIGVFNHRPITQEELYTISQLAPAAVAAVRVTELLTRTHALRYRLEKKTASDMAEGQEAVGRASELEDAVAQLTRQVAQLQVERDSLLRASEEASQRIEQLESGNHELQENADALMAAGRKANDVYSERVSNSESERQKLEEENLLLKGQIETLAKNVDELSNLRQVPSSEMEDRDREIERLQSELEVNEAELAAAREELPEYAEKISLLEEANAGLREENIAISESMNDLESSLRLAEDARSRLEQERMALEQQVAQMSEEIEQLRLNSGRATGEKEQLSAEIERLYGENQRLTAETERLRGKVDELQAAAADLSERDAHLAAIEKESAEARAQSDKRIAELEGENAALRQVNIQFEEAATQFEALTARLEESAIKLRDRVKAGDSERTQIEQRNHLVEKENRRLKLESRAKARFLADVSHEFRTPMNAIIGFTSALLEDGDLKLSDRHHRNLERVAYNARDLLDLITNVLDLSKIEAGRMDVYSEPADVRNLIEHSLGIAEPLKDGRPINLGMEISDKLPALRTDRMKLQQILVNLLSNAIKFTNEGEVKVTAERADEDRIRIAVSDTGIGIAESDIPKIFEEFSQVGPYLRTGKPGTGLGLAITRRLVKLLGGEIEVSSKPGEGSVFSVTLPLEIEDQIAEAADPIGPLIDPDRTALVIDSDPSSLYLTKKYLAEEDYSVAVTSDAGQGVEIARLAKPAVITVDVDSLEDGIGLIEQIAQGDKSGLLIAISADEAKGARALETGADIFLRKPIERAEMIEAMKQVPVSAQTDADALPAHRLLIVDDDPDALDVVREMIEDKGYEVITASNGREALDRVEDSRPDAIILDLMLPEMDGFEIVHRLSLNPDRQSIPVILLTARDLSLEERRALDTGTTRMIQKGNFSRDELLNEIRVAIEASGEESA